MESIWLRTQRKRSSWVVVLALIAALLGFASYPNLGTALADEPSCSVVECSSDATLPDDDTLKRALDTGPNQAYFWTGWDDNGGSAETKALAFATNNGGTTLEGALDRADITMPQYEQRDPTSIEVWEKASRIFAEQASGITYVVVDKNTRDTNVFVTKELPALQANGLVMQVVRLDPQTGEQAEVLYERSDPPTDGDDDGNDNGDDDNDNGSS